MIHVCIIYINVRECNGKKKKKCNGILIKS